jgi:hypothetical protein
MRIVILAASALAVAGLTAFQFRGHATDAGHAANAGPDDVVARLAMDTDTPDVIGTPVTDGGGRWGRRVSRERELEIARIIDTWTRPDVPVRVALQAGHWKAAEAPDEQSGLRTNGTRGGGKAEWEVNLAIARRAAALLEDAGYEVDVLPTTIPPGYWADVFVSIHADGNASTSASGYRAAAPRRDATGRADELAALLERSYGEATRLPYYPTITRRMTSYYAFNYRRYQHALHPMTVGAIIETGFLTNPRDRGIIVTAPDRAARGIADGIIRFLGPVSP